MTGPATEARALTGVAGLDHVLGGGLPSRRLHLVQGPPGSGKTTLALHFLLEGVRRGERCLYISLSESAEEVRAAAASHGWSLDGIAIFEGLAESADDENTLFQPSEIELGERMGRILAEVERLQPARVVLDSCSELRLLAGSELRYRRQILALKRQLVERHRTVLLVDNPAPGSPDVLLQSLAHGVIALDHLSPLFGAARRRLNVLKMRGIAYSGGYHDFVIRTGGISVFPRLVAAEHRGTHDGAPVPSGVPALDQLLGGGPHRGTSTLVMGPSGVGKSALVTVYAVTAAARGERVAMFGFDESRATTLARARSLGIDLATHVESGRILLQQVDPAELSPGEFSEIVRDAADRGGARIVAIDSLNGYLQAMPDEKFLTIQLHELLSFLGQRGVLTLLLVAEHGLVGAELAAPTDVSYLADTVILMRYFEAHGGVHKAISVMKKRTGAHENTIRELTVGVGGLRVGPPLTEFHGVLRGVPLYEGNRAGRG
jgi:circadian clock protein KaiC